MCYPKKFFFYFLLSSFHLPVYLSALYHPSMHGTFNKLLNDVWTRGPRVPDTVFHRITRWQVVGYYVSNACYPKFTAALMKNVLFPAGPKLDCHSFIFKTSSKAWGWEMRVDNFRLRMHRILSDAATALPRDCMRRFFLVTSCWAFTLCSVTFCTSFQLFCKTVNQGQKMKVNGSIEYF